MFVLHQNRENKGRNMWTQPINIDRTTTNVNWLKCIWLGVSFPFHIRWLIRSEYLGFRFPYQNQFHNFWFIDFCTNCRDLFAKYERLRCNVQTPITCDNLSSFFFYSGAYLRRGHQKKRKKNYERHALCPKLNFQVCDCLLSKLSNRIQTRAHEEDGRVCVWPKRFS